MGPFALLAALAFAGLVYGCGAKLRSDRRKAEAELTVAEVTTTSVTPRTGYAYGEPASWDDVVGEFVDATGAKWVVTKTGAGSPWRPKVGSTFHLLYRPGEPVRRGMLGALVEVTYPNGFIGAGRILEADIRSERFILGLGKAIAVGSVLWAVTDWVL